MPKRCADSILQVYRNHGFCQAENNTIADGWSIVLCGGNSIGRLAQLFLAERTESVVKKRQDEQYKKKAGGGQANVSVTLSEGNFSGIRLFGI